MSKKYDKGDGDDDDDDDDGALFETLMQRAIRDPSMAVGWLHGRPEDKTKSPAKSR